MRTKYFRVSVLLLPVLILAACAGQGTPQPNVEGAISTADATFSAATEVLGQGETASTLAASTAVQTAAVEDFNTLVDALQAAGTTVESGDQVSQPFFNVAGQILKVNGQDVQVFVYDTAQAMETEATQVSADGSTIGTNMPSWMDAPHFYKAGRMLVLYVGQDQKILDILASIFGPQFAGQ